jgi:hypothetical protein
VGALTGCRKRAVEERPVGTRCDGVVVADSKRKRLTLKEKRWRDLCREGWASAREHRDQLSTDSWSHTTHDSKVPVELQTNFGALEEEENSLTR